MTYDDLLNEWMSPAPVMTAHTSGSTGTPKQILLTKEMMRRSARRTIDYFGINSASRLHSCISPEFIGGKMMLIRALVCGARFTWEEPSNRPFADLGADDRLDLVSVVPSQMRHIIDCQQDIPRVKAFLIGGSAIHPALRHDIVGSGLKGFESYGMTETSSHIAIRPVTDDDSPFETLPGITLDADADGCLVIHMGTDGSIVTNDLVRFADSFHQKFHIIGRRDHIIVTGGKKVNPAEVESAISDLLPGIEYCITSRPDPLWSNRVVLMVEYEPQAIDTQQLTQQMKQILPVWEVPKEIITVKELPRTASGKIIRPHLS